MISASGFEVFDSGTPASAPATHLMSDAQERCTVIIVESIVMMFQSHILMLPVIDLGCLPLMACR